MSTLQKLSTLFLISLFSYAQEPALPIEFLQMTTAVTVMPTILPTYVTVQHFNPPPHVKRRQEIEKFFNENFESLKEEIAKGEGEYLDTLVLLYEVENTSLWKEYLQCNFEEIYQEGKSEKEILNHIDNVTNRKFKASKIYTVEEYNEVINSQYLDATSKKKSNKK
jgi:hypothetical protein